MKSKINFLDRIIFQRQILKIKNTNVMNYFSSLFLVKNIILKTIIFLYFIFFICVLCFGIRQYYIDYQPNKIILNPGIAFGKFGDSSSIVVYIIQCIPIILSFIGILFISKWWIYIGLVMMFAGGLSNVIDRGLDGLINGSSLKNQVIDYFPTFNNVYFNVPDIFVVGGAIYLGLSFVVNIGYFLYKDENKKNESKH